MLEIKFLLMIGKSIHTFLYYMEWGATKITNVFINVCFWISEHRLKLEYHIFGPEGKNHK